MLSPKAQTNLKNAKGYFEEHLSVGDYYAEDAQVRANGSVQRPLYSAYQARFPG